MTLDIDIVTLRDKYTIPHDPYTGGRVWITDIFEHLTYEEILEAKKRLVEYYHVNIMFDAVHMLELMRKIERLEQRVSDLELRNELSKE